MNVVDKDGNLLATLQWDGSIWDGKGEWIFYKDERTRELIIRAIEGGKKDLGKMEVDSMYANCVNVPIWKGFSGMLGGLNLSLPTYGMYIDRQTIEWPGGGIKDYEEDGLP